MFNGAHVILNSTDAEADRAFLRDVLGFSHVDVGGGWLIFALPPSEVAVHPHETASDHALYLMCADMAETRATLQAAGLTTSEPVDEGWGILSSLVLPGGGTIGFYQPRHARPTDPAE